MLGDASTKGPSNLIGLNGRKRKEWEAWNMYRGVSQNDAKKFFLNSMILHGVYKDKRTKLGKAFDQFAEKHAFFNF
jgi:acyl-CoA-binding protein